MAWRVGPPKAQTQAKAYDGTAIRLSPTPKAGQNEVIALVTKYATRRSIRVIVEQCM